MLVYQRVSQELGNPKKTVEGGDKLLGDLGNPQCEQKMMKNG